MKTAVWSGKEVEVAASAIRGGEAVAFPTETVYGLGALAFDAEAVRKVFAIKGRPSDNPLIVHIASLKELDGLVAEIPEGFDRLIERFWPGPLTLIFKRKTGVPDVVTGGMESVAIRFPSHPVARRLIEAVGAPLVAPSANLSGRPSPTSARDVLEDLEGKIVGVIDGGACPIGIESTVLSLVSKPWTVYRPGSISLQELQEVVDGEIAVYEGSGEGAPSPGMRYRHYAPRAQVRLVFREEELTAPWVLSRLPLLGRETRELSAKSLYRELREGDRRGVDLIEVYCDEGTRGDLALMNRLKKASGV